MPREEDLGEYSTSPSIGEYDADYHRNQNQQQQQQHGDLQDDYDENDEESRRLHLVRTISAIEAHDFEQKFDSISREISRQVTNKEGEFQLNLDEFNLGKILANFVYFARKQGIVLRKSGITFKDLCVYGVDDSVAIVPTVMDILKGPVAGISAAIKKAKHQIE